MAVRRFFAVLVVLALLIVGTLVLTHIASVPPRPRESTLPAPAPSEPEAAARPSMPPPLATRPSEAPLREPAPTAALRPSVPRPVERYPTMEAPAEVAVGQDFALQVSLTEQHVGPGVVVVAGEKTPSGKMALPLPAPASEAGWAIEVVLSAPGFDLSQGSNVASIRLPLAGDSTPAMFRLKAVPLKASREDRLVYATLWHRRTYLGRIARSIAVVTTPSPAAAGASRRTVARAAALEPSRPSPDLTLFVLDSPDGRGQGQLIVLSPHLQPSTSTFQIPAGLPTWLDAQYDRFVLAITHPEAKDHTMALLRGFGRELYRRFAPSAFKEAFWRLRDRLGSEFRTIQIYTNIPLLPWELMRPTRADGTDEQDFLGIDFRVARWHVTETAAGLDRPPVALSVRELVAVAPSYTEVRKLATQERELQALRLIRGFRALPGRLEPLRTLFSNFPQGIIHFSGHGEVRSIRLGVLEYVVQLEDGDLDVLTFRGLTKPASRTHPFVFFNACSIGAAQRVTNFVDGWAPATLEAGASGYVGGLWLLGDEGAADFAGDFYRIVGQELGRGSAPVAEILQQVRRRFYDTGDPTYLAYVYYGDAHFRFVPAVDPKN
jgi:hypothetical protein